MKVEPLAPDIAPRLSTNPATTDGFTRALDDVGALLNGASAAEDRYAIGTGSLQAAMVERARADVALAVATAAAQRSAQALTAIINMQI